MQYDRHFSAGPEGKEMHLFRSLLKQDWHRSQRADTSTQTSQEPNQVLRAIFSDSGGHACSCCCDTTWVKAAWGGEGLLGSQTHPQGNQGCCLLGCFRIPFLYLFLGPAQGSTPQQAGTFHIYQQPRKLLTCQSDGGGSVTEMPSSQLSLALCQADKTNSQVGICTFSLLIFSQVIYTMPEISSTKVNLKRNSWFAQFYY